MGAEAEFLLTLKYKHGINVTVQPPLVARGGVVLDDGGDKE